MLICALRRSAINLRTMSHMQQ